VIRRKDRLLRLTLLLGASLAAIDGRPSPAPAFSPSQSPATAPSPYSLDRLMGYTFPSELIAAPTGQRLAWTMLQRGKRTLWVADGPDFRGRAIVTYADDDGQELTHLAFTHDGQHLVWVRGGDHGANWPAEGKLMPDPDSSPRQPKMQVFSVAVASGGAPVLLGEGDAPAPSPDGKRVAFERNGEIWIAPIDGTTPAARLFFARGESSTPVWSPDGRMLAFVSDRGSLGYIGIYTSDEQPLRYLAPSSGRDEDPAWSPDGKRIAFVRRPGRGGPAAPPLQSAPRPWSIVVADVATGEGRPVWRSPETLPGAWSAPTGSELAWAAGDRLVFLSYEDKWPHLYSVSAAGPAAGGAPLRLTTGEFQVEDVILAPDGRSVIYNANTGGDKDDIERRHLFRVPVDAARPVALTRGTGLEWGPAVTADGRTVAFFASTPQRPGLPFVMPIDAGAAASAGGAAGATVSASAARGMSDDLLAADFPASQLVTPEHVTFKSEDGVTVHGQLFKPAGAPTASGAAARAPAIVFVHGGPQRQMLLGWHYMFYYTNSYALNQYLASRGFIVLSVNYRLGIGYGFDFHQPANAGARGASEYLDVIAGGRYLQTRSDVDAARVGIWGGSYGGFLTAMGLGRNSDVFKAGVDLHGVHHRVQLSSDALQAAASVGDGVTQAQLDEAARVAWSSSPASTVKTWKSPVLLIHGDDDRNVRVDQTVDLVQRLAAAGVSFEEIILPDEIHDFLLYRNWLRANRATADFFDRKLKPSAAPGMTRPTGGGNPR
jgi:dipeptidyl aminopeptidase/acylaminoacyl peptidase